MKALNVILAVILATLIIGCSKGEGLALCDTDEEDLAQHNESIEHHVEEEPVLKEDPKLIMIHNGRGIMCLSELQFLKHVGQICPSLVIEEHNTDYSSTSKVMGQLMVKYSKSIGVSTRFEYLPFTFINNKAYSGFNDDIKEQMIIDIEEICK